MLEENTFRPYVIDNASRTRMCPSPNYTIVSRVLSYDQSTKNVLCFAYNVISNDKITSQMIQKKLFYVHKSFKQINDLMYVVSPLAHILWSGFINANPSLG